MILNGLPWKQTDHSLVFEVAPKYCILDSFFSSSSYEADSTSKGFLPIEVDIMSSELNSPIPIHISSLIPKMSPSPD